MYRRYIKIIGLSCIVVLVAVLIVRKVASNWGYVNYGVSRSCDIAQPGYDGRQYSSYQTLGIPSNNSSQYTYLSLSVNDSVQTQTYLSLLVSKYGGRSINSSEYRLSGGTQRGGMLVFEIPVSYQNAVLIDIRNLRKVQSESQSGSSYSAPMIRYDQQTTISQIKEQRDRLLEAYTKQHDPQISRGIEAELSQLDSQLRSVEANMYSAPQQSYIATITVSYCETHLSFSAATGDILLKGLRSLVSIGMFFVNMINGLIGIVTYFLPIVIWVVLISLAIFFGSKFFIR